MSNKGKYLKAIILPNTLSSVHSTFDKIDIIFYLPVNCVTDLLWINFKVSNYLMQVLACMPAVDRGGNVSGVVVRPQNRIRWLQKLI